MYFTGAAQQLESTLMLMLLPRGGVPSVKNKL
jgi:hypothetical protein